MLNVLLTLTLSIGAPFFLLSTTSPMIQRWFSLKHDETERQPYFLFAVSNAGALSALLSYPIIVEPLLTINQQLWVWYGGYVVYSVGLFVCMCGPSAERQRSQPNAEQVPSVEKVAKPLWRERFFWLLASAVGSALLLAVTHSLTMDLASIPLLWMLPLGIYISTFILNFSNRPKATTLINRFSIGTALLFTVLLSVFRSYVHHSAYFSLVDILLHLFLLFIFCMICHGQLYAARPKHSSWLPNYYLYIGLGGWVGSAIIAMGIPVLAQNVWYASLEYVVCAFLGLVALALRGVHVFRTLPKMRKLFAGLVGVILLTILVFSGFPHRNKRFASIVLARRNFYGIYHVTDGAKFRSFYHGSTVHGIQSLDIARSPEPLAYYHRDGPVGDLLALERPIQNVAMVGLGVGAILAYSKAGQNWDVYELDPDVVDIAQTYFVYVKTAKVKPRFILGDARLNLDKAEDHFYDMLILDAFSSDAIPVHLLTKEALQLYLEKLRPDGLLVFHIGNRHLALRPVLTALAEDLELNHSFRVDSTANMKIGKWRSEWFVMSKEPAHINHLIRQGWKSTHVRGLFSRARIWTDRYSSILLPLAIKYLSKKKLLTGATVNPLRSLADN